jgi:hypothetical protein
MSPYVGMNEPAHDSSIDCVEVVTALNNETVGVATADGRHVCRSSGGRRREQVAMHEGMVRATITTESSLCYLQTRTYTDICTYICSDHIEPFCACLLGALTRAPLWCVSQLPYICASICVPRPSGCFVTSRGGPGKRCSIYLARYGVRVWDSRPTMARQSGRGSLGVSVHAGDAFVNKPTATLHFARYAAN